MSTSVIWNICDLKKRTYWIHKNCTGLSILIYLLEIAMVKDVNVLFAVI